MVYSADAQSCSNLRNYICEYTMQSGLFFAPSCTDSGKSCIAYTTQRHNFDDARSACTSAGDRIGRIGDVVVEEQLTNEILDQIRVETT